MRRLFVAVKSGAQMDRATRVTLWIAFIVLASYFVGFFVDCALDDACRIVCAMNVSRGGCHAQWTPDAK